MGSDRRSVFLGMSSSGTRLLHPLLPQPEKLPRNTHGRRVRAGGSLNILVGTRYVGRGLEGPAWPPGQDQRVAGTGKGQKLVRHDFAGRQNPGGVVSSGQAGRIGELNLGELIW